MATVSGVGIRVVKREVRGQQELRLRVEPPSREEEPWVVVGPCWTTPPQLKLPEEGLPVQALPAAVLTLQVPEGQQLPAVVGRFLALGEGDTTPGPVWAFPFFWAGSRWEARVPFGPWRGTVYVPGFSEQDLGVLNLSPGRPVPPVAWTGKPAGSFRARVSGVLGDAHFSLWAWPEARWQEGFCTLTSPGQLGQMPGGAWVELGGWVRRGGLAPGRYLLAANPPGLPEQLWGPFELAGERETDLGLLEAGEAQLEVAWKGPARFLGHPHHRLLAWVWPQALQSPQCVLTAPIGEDLFATFALPPGRFRAHVMATVYLSQRALEGGSGEDVTLLPGERRWVALEHPYPVVEGDVLSRGKGATCLVHLTIRTSGGEEHSTAGWSLADGRFALLGVPEGVGFSHLRCTAPSAEAYLPRVKVVWGQKLTLSLPSGEVQAVVVDGEGFPLADREVSLWFLPEDGEPAPFEGMRKRKTNPRGEVRFSHLAPGRYQVWSVSPQGTETPRLRVVLAAEGGKKEVRLVEGSEGLRLRVLGPHGGTVRGVKGLALGLPGDGWQAGEAPGGALQSVADHYTLPFSVDGLESLLLHLVVPGGGVLCRRAERWQWQGVEELAVLQPSAWGALEVQVPWVGAHMPPVALATAQGAVCSFWDLASLASEAVKWHPDRRNLRLPRLEPGRYQVVLQPNRRLPFPAWPQSPESRTTGWVDVVPATVTRTALP